MTGPIVGGGRLIITIHFSRGIHTPAFDAEDLTRWVLYVLTQPVSQPSKSSQSELNPLGESLTQRRCRLLIYWHKLTNAERYSPLITQNSVKQA